MPFEPLGDPGGASRSRRLPPIALVFSLLRSLRTYALPIVAVLFFSRGNGYETWLLVFLLPSFALGFFRYLTFSYELGPEDLVVRTGLLFRKERHIPYTRIQNVDLRQNLLHRLAGVAVVRLETGSGGAAEAEIEVLGQDAIEELRAAVFRRGTAIASPESPEFGEPVTETDFAEKVAPASTLLALGAKDLVMRGLLTGRGLLLFAAIFGFAQQFDVNLFDFWDYIDAEDMHRQVDAVSGMDAETIGNRVVGWTLEPRHLGLALVLISVVFVATRILSILWTLITFWGFQLRRRGEDLTTEQGLLTRVSATLPRHRIQALELRTSWLDGLFGKAAVVAATAGRGISAEDQADNPAAASAELFLAPILPRAEAESLVRELAPELYEGELVWRGLAAGTFPRLVRRRILLLVMPATVALYFLGPWALVPLLLYVAFTITEAWRWTKNSRWALGDNAIFWQTGAFSQVSKVVPLEKIQVVSVASSPFDRRRGTATVSVDTAATDLTRPTLFMPYLEADAAQELAAKVERETGRRSFRW